jgi:hypothetical protein
MRSSDGLLVRDCRLSLTGLEGFAGFSGRFISFCFFFLGSGGTYVFSKFSINSPQS